MSKPTNNPKSALDILSERYTKATNQPMPSELLQMDLSIIARAVAIVEKGYSFFIPPIEQGKAKTAGKVRGDFENENLPMVQWDSQDRVF